MDSRRYKASWYKKNRRKLLAKAKRYRERHKKEISIRTKEQNLQLKLQALAIYGGVCICCSEWRHEFLSIDHIKGGGTKHRKEVGAGSAFYWWLRKNKYPKGFRTMCHNCNMAVGFYGRCPHADT